MKNSFFCLLLILSAIFFDNSELLAQSGVSAAFELPEIGKQEVLTSEVINIADSAYLVRISSIDQGLTLFDIRNVLFDAMQIRESFAKISRDLENLKKEQDSLNILEDIHDKGSQADKSADEVHGRKDSMTTNTVSTSDSVSGKRDTMISGKDAVTVQAGNDDNKEREENKTKISNMEGQLDSIKKQEFARIFYMAMPNPTASNLAGFLLNSMRKGKLVDTTLAYSTVLDEIIRKKADELMFTSRIKSVQDSVIRAGTLCINKRVNIYPSRNILSGAVKTNEIHKGLRIGRRLKFPIPPKDEQGEKNKKSSAANEARKSVYDDIQNDLINNKTSIDFNVHRSGWDAISKVQDKVNFVKHSNFKKIMTSGMLDKEEKLIIYKYMLAPENVRMKHCKNLNTRRVKAKVSKFASFITGYATGETLVVEEVSFEIRESSIHNIQIKGRLKQDPGSWLVFDNRNIPYPMSSQKFLKDKNKFIPLESRAVRRSQNSGFPVLEKYSMNLWDLIEYFPEFQLGGDNLAPADTTFTIKLQDIEQNCSSLNRIMTSKLFELKVYSDPLGFESDVPNGLVQFEVNRRFTTVPRSTKLNGFTFVEPKFVWSKIEDKANLAISTQARVNKDSAISHIDLVRYSKLQLDVKANGATLALPASSMILHLNAGVGFYQTSVEDSVYDYAKTVSGTDSIVALKEVNKENINTMNYYIDLDIRFRPDNRYNLLLNTHVGKFNPLSEFYNTIKGDTNTGRIFNYISSSLEASANVSGERYFFRGVFTADIAHPKDNFFQLQIGIAKTLFKSK